MSFELCFLSFSLHADISEPDNLVYGTIVLGSNVVTAARSDVVVEARRTPTGSAVASYQMGSDPRLSNFYLLHITLESSLPVVDADGSLVGDALVVVVLDSTGIRSQATYTVQDRGTVQRLDFGVAVADSDGDGLPDDWETLNFGNLNQTPNSINANGQTTLENYIAGTNPNDTNSAFSLSLSVTNGMRLISFLALQAEGPGYAGLSRYYSIEYSTNLDSNVWLALGGFTNLLASNQVLSYQTTATNSPAFYRGKVWLQGP